MLCYIDSQIKFVVHGSNDLVQQLCTYFGRVCMFNTIMDGIRVLNFACFELLGRAHIKLYVQRM